MNTRIEISDLPVGKKYICEIFVRPADDEKETAIIEQTPEPIPESRKGKYPKTRKPAGYWQVPYNSHSQPNDYFGALRIAKKHGVPYPEAIKLENAKKQPQSAPVPASKPQPQKPEDLPKEPVPAPGKVAPTKPQDPPEIEIPPTRPRFVIGDKVRQIEPKFGKVLKETGKVIDIVGEMIRVKDGGKEYRIFSGNLESVE